MREIDASAVRQWHSQNGLWSPYSFAIVCPHCLEKATFTASNVKREPEWELVTSSAQCPSCTKRVFVWAIGCKGTVEAVKAGRGTLSIHPHPHDIREPIHGIENAPERIQRAYKEALDAYNGHLWNSAVGNCRRTLEGIVKNRLPAEQQKGTLYQQIERLPDHVDLQMPLIDLTHAVRQGGNLGSHFDDERDADQSVAKAAIDLIEFFFEFLYVLPTQVEDLQNQLKAIDEDDDEVS